MSKKSVSPNALHSGSVKAPLLVLFGIAALCVLIDQLTKFWAVAWLQPHGDIPLWKGVLHLHYAQNTGMAFSLFAEHTWILAAATSVLITALCVFSILKRKELPLFCLIVLGMIIGGGIGNLIDRVFLGYVVDFIYFKLIDFAIFNGADSCISVGSVLLMIYLLFIYKEKPAEPAVGEEPHG